MTAPKSFIKRRFLTFTVAFEIVFSIAFLILYKPLSNTFWLALSPRGTFIRTALFYLSVLALTIVSKVLLGAVEKRMELSVTQMTLWHLGEFACISGIYIAFTYAFHLAPATGQAQMFIRAFLCVGVILFIPYLICLLLAVIKDDREEIRLLKLNNPLTPVPADTPIINLYDHSSVLRISASQEDIVYVESQDNYVNIHYRGDDKLMSYLLRCSTAEIEEALKGSPIVRCHRSYLVNLNRIKVLKHGKSRATIVLSDKDGTEIPVSKSYYKILLEALTPGQIVRSTRNA